MARSGLLRLRAALTNSDPTVDYSVDGVTITVPVPAGADELLDLTGRHARERVPQRAPFNVGTHLRESRQGKPGLDGALLLIAGTPGFDFTSGEVWGVHTGLVGQPADVRRAHVQRSSAAWARGELLLAGEIAARAGRDLPDTVDLRVLRHRTQRDVAAIPRVPAVATRAPDEAAAGADQHLGGGLLRQDLDTLVGLARAAAAVGAERFVLDDGWFRHRRNDHAGLGDWYVDDDVWPDGLGPLIAEVHGLGMDFGLWVEPEMINLDSDLARAHPEWIFRAGGRDGHSRPGSNTCSISAIPRRTTTSPGACTTCSTPTTSPT